MKKMYEKKTFSDFLHFTCILYFFDLFLIKLSFLLQKAILSKFSFKYRKTSNFIPGTKLEVKKNFGVMKPG